MNFSLFPQNQNNTRQKTFACERRENRRSRIMFTALRSAFTENTRSSVGLNDLAATTTGDGGNETEHSNHPQRKYVKLSEVRDNVVVGENTSNSNTGGGGGLMPEYHQHHKQSSSSSSSQNMGGVPSSPVSKKPPTYVQLVSAIVGILCATRSC